VVPLRPFPEHLQEFPVVTKILCPTTQHFCTNCFAVLLLLFHLHITIYRLSHIFHFLFRKLFHINVT
jgi:hypothetical protein